jgi:hypothetical protein
VIRRSEGVQRVFQETDRIEVAILPRLLLLHVPDQKLRWLLLAS